MPPPPPNPAAEKAAFLTSHVYSTAPEAGPKLRIDQALMGGDFANRARINMKDADYLKQLIYLATGGRRVVAMGAKGKGLQFYMIKGGGEGFLKPYYKGKDASRHVTGDGATTGNSSGGVTMIFDNNDLLAVFDSEGKLLGSALLKRPISITDPSEKDPLVWTEGTANQIYLRRLGRTARDALSQQGLRHRLLRPDDLGQARLVRQGQGEGGPAQTGEDERLHLHRRSGHAAARRSGAA